MTNPGNNVDSDSNPLMQQAEENPPIVDASIVPPANPSVIDSDIIDAELAPASTTTVESPLPLAFSDEEVISASLVSVAVEPSASNDIVELPETSQSWLFRFTSAIGKFLTHSFGISSVVFLLARRCEHSDCFN